MDRIDEAHGLTATRANGNGANGRHYLARIPVRRRHDVIIVPVEQVASLVSDGELLNITTVRNERHTITCRLKDMESRLDPTRFIKLARGVLANIEAITKVTFNPTGGSVAVLANGQVLRLSRGQARVVRDQLLTI
jgi:two-component system LytT family response regulator